MRDQWPPSAGQPELNPAALVADVIQLLRDLGMAVKTAISSTAIIASADLLRAIGVRPGTSPRQGDRS